jgi:uncharacterized 2Fe-2S/4Fe-4S cluster protein (DUF4445 family)
MSEENDQTGAFIIDFEPVGRRARVQHGGSLLDASRNSGVGLVSLCGGEGWCESCIVRLEKGECQPPTEAEQLVFGGEALAEGYRLACQAIPASDVKVYLPPESLSAPQRLQVEGEEAAIGFDPLVQVVELSLPAPTLTDQRADTQRLHDALTGAGYPAIEIDFPLLATLSVTLREQNWQVRVVLRSNRLAAILPRESRVTGLAIDIGTTKLAGYLVDLTSGETLAKAGAMNPQIAYGEDVISRIAYAQQGPDERKTLQACLVEALNAMLDELCLASNVTQDQVVEAVIVGNTAMHHLFAGLPVRQLALAPYVPAVNEPLSFPAGQVGLRLAPGGMIQLLPNIAGYVGADHVAVIIATRLWKIGHPVMAIDIGTNTEISLAVNGSLYSCSCASGPAFEGAHIRDGMRAAPGAIERVLFIDGVVHIFTIGEQAPVGICGSGILDAVAELRRLGILDGKGAFNADYPGVRPSPFGREFLLAAGDKTAHGRDITISRRDVNEIQLAKAAIRTGIDVLLETAGIQALDVKEWIIAGAFGTYINLESAMQIGLFPQAPLQRFKQVGNAAGMGAKQALLSRQSLAEAEQAARATRYTELTTYAGFQDRFLKAMYL